MPQLVEFSGQRYREWFDLSPDAFLQKLKLGNEMPSSTPTSVEDFVAALRPLVEEGCSVLCIGPSSQVSKTLEVIAEAARHFPQADIRLFDTRSIASTNASLALLAAHWAAEGEDADQIEARLKELIPHARVYFLVDTLDYLVRGGRIGGAAGLVGKLLQLKPILTMRNGQVDQYEMARTYKHALVRLQDLALEWAGQEWDLHLCVMHAGCAEVGQALAHDLEWKLSLPRIPVYDIPPTITCHTGPGALGVSFFSGEIK